MNIVLFTNAYFPHLGGVEWTVFHLGNRFSMLGHSVHIITAQNKTHCGESSRDTVNGDIRIHRIAVPRSWPITRFRIWCWLYRHRDIFMHADVLHFFDYGTLIHWYLPFLFFSKKQIRVLTFCGFDSFPVRWRDRILRRISASLVKNRISVGGYISKWFKTRTEYCYLGAPTRERLDPLPSTSGDISFIGRLENDTGFDVYLDVLERLAGRIRKRITFNVFGNGSLEDYYVNRNDHYFSIRYHGTVDTLEWALRSSEIICASSYLSIFDAMQAGKCVVIYIANELKKDYIHDIPRITECAFVSETKSQLSRQLEIALTSEEQRTRKSRSASELLNRLSWDKIARDHLELYEKGRVEG